MAIIEVIVLLSLAIQLLLFFAGRFQLYISDKILRSFIGFAYLGQNWAALYALGNFSRQDGSTHSIAFLWVPFLLVHLGGTDTITAWTIEDNNSWLSDLSRLGMHVALAGYAFWRLIGGHNWMLVASAVLVFVTGIIKYGEKTWSFKSGSIQSLQDSTGGHLYKIELPGMSNSNVQEASNGNAQIPEAQLLIPEKTTPYPDTVWSALRSMCKVHDIFAARKLDINKSSSEESGVRVRVVADPDKAVHQSITLEVVQLQLEMMRDDLYTKALLLRTRGGLVCRLMSVISSCAAFALFLLADDKQGYSEADVTITYSLFVGWIFLELCSVIVLMMSPWTWAWFESRGLGIPAHFSWFLLCSVLGSPAERPRWPTPMGQCNIMHMMAGIYEPRSWTPKAMLQLRTLLNRFGLSAGKEQISWLGNLIHTEYVTVDNSVMKHVLEGLGLLFDEVTDQSKLPRKRSNLYRFPILCSFLSMVQDVFVTDFGSAVLILHSVTDSFLSEYRGRMAQLSLKEVSLVEVCTKLSNYMVYLMVNHPSSLPLNTSTVASLKSMEATFKSELAGADGYRRYDNIKRSLLDGEQPTGEAPLKELIDMWTRVLLYAAGRTKPEHHAAHLARGGELITIAWLHMANRGMGDSKLKRILITNYYPDGSTNYMEARAFFFPPAESSIEGGHLRRILQRPRRSHNI